MVEQTRLFPLFYRVRGGVICTWICRNERTNFGASIKVAFEY